MDWDDSRLAASPLVNFLWPQEWFLQDEFIGGPFGRPKIRCLIVDGHALVRHGMRRLLEDEPDIEVVEEAGNTDDALQKLGLHQPDVVLMDTGLPGCRRRT